MLNTSFQSLAEGKTGLEQQHTKLEEVKKQWAECTDLNVAAKEKNKALRAKEDKVLADYNFKKVRCCTTVGTCSGIPEKTGGTQAATRGGQAGHCTTAILQG